MDEKEILEQLKNRDHSLVPLLDSTGFPHYKNTHDVFEDVCSCILDMRIHYTPTGPAFRYPRLKKLLNGGSITPELILDFPDEILLPLKLSHQKLESLKICAKKWVEESLGQLNWVRLSDEEVLSYLQGIKGVGDWTKQMILMFTLKRSDIFPKGDYQLTKAMCEYYGLEEKKGIQEELEQIASNWTPYRSVVVRCFWKWRRAKS